MTMQTRVSSRGSRDPAPGTGAAALGRRHASNGVEPESSAASIPRVGLFIESSRASGRALLHGIARFIHHTGPWSVYWEPGGLERALPRLKALHLQGIIARDVNSVEQVVSLGIPAVVVGHSRREIPGLVNVLTDSEVIACMAAEHLLGCGFQHFAYCGLENTALENVPWSLSRKAAFTRRVEQAGWTCQVYAPVHQHRRRWDQELGELVRWLRSIRTPCGLMACNDDRGEQVLEACRLAHLSVPNDIAVIGVDNDEVVCGLSNPPLSSIAVDFARTGFEAAEALGRMIAGRRDVPAVICANATHVVARRSTEVIAVGDANLSKALHFIRERSGGATSVATVARHAGISRRSLEKRFRALLGRSVLEEIRRVRTNRIAQLLVETDLPIARIADLVGFTDSQHVARYFRTAKRLSPAAYRKAYGGKEWCAQNGDFFAQNGVVLHPD